MEDSPELVKLLKYLLFGYLVIQIPLSSFALVLAEKLQAPHWTKRHREKQQRGGSQGHGGMMMMMMGDKSAYPQQQQARRHQQHDLDDEQINTSGEVDMANVAEAEGIICRSSRRGGRGGDHQSLDGMGHHGGPGDDLIDETKISQDRTMILVPERSCPQGQRRDARGYCRRMVKIRTNYEYGPPLLRSSGSQQQQNSLVRPIPIRYYYSRIVSIPAFQFFYPNVRV
ncbi:hypothetical protein Fcan01_27576 [Folsomia candida]|uniref:Uncharacterized protein n=1 Tax=Folsomia candida TaxID=158441 RepID=A0A226CYU1_FOLCA|nr:hypothetical protein Fcan01_27576 [Folsomia candida]